MRLRIFHTIGGILFALHTIACCNAVDSLSYFLNYVGEDSITISRIIHSEFSIQPEKTIDTYLSLKFKLTYNTEKQELDWVLGWDDSVFVCRCTEYVTEKILCDTNLLLIDRYLLEAYVTNHRYEEKMILESAICAISTYNARSAILIPELYYYNHRELDNWFAQYIHYSMIKYILLSRLNTFCIETNLCTWVNTLQKILTEDSNDKFYKLFREKLDNYSDLDLARLNSEQKQSIENILLQGCLYQDKKAMTTYAFMLLTGTIIKTDTNKGLNILSMVLDVSPLERYFPKEYNPQ